LHKDLFMKRIYIAYALILPCVITFSQDPRKITYNPASGYVTINELNYGNGMGSLSYYGNYFFGITTMHGYQLNIYNLNTDIAVIAGGATGFYTFEDYTLIPLYVDLRVVNNFDKWVLMSGDGDFIDLCRYLKEQNKFVEVWSVKGSSFNKGFCDYADEIKFLGPSFFYDKNSVTKKEPPCAAQE